MQRAEVATIYPSSRPHPQAVDMYMESYSPCNITGDGSNGNSASGVCPDTVLAASNATLASSVRNNVQLVSADRSGGVTTMRLTRPLAAVDVYDNPIDLNQSQTFIWVGSNCNTIVTFPPFLKFPFSAGPWLLGPRLVAATIVPRPPTQARATRRHARHLRLS